MEITSSTAAIVTGGASGLGEACSRLLTQKGARVAIFDLNEDKGNALADEIGATFVKVNVADEQSVTEGIATARKANGIERILINCAGIGIAEKTAKIDRNTGEPVPHNMDAFTRTISINLVGSFQMASKCAAGMMKLDPHNEDGGRGVIINTASIAAIEGQIGQAAYSASKGGIVGMTLPIARDLAQVGIRCCSILPGLFETPLLASLPEEARQSLAAGIPHPARLGNPVEFAELAAQIIANEMLNGECIRLDGALRMAPR